MIFFNTGLYPNHQNKRHDFEVLVQNSKYKFTFQGQNPNSLNFVSLRKSLALYEKTPNPADLTCPPPSRFLVFGFSCHHTANNLIRSGTHTSGAQQ